MSNPSLPSKIVLGSRAGQSLDVWPPVALAPMAGITHSPFRALVADFGGTGLFFSEMLSARSLPQERPDSPYLIKTPGEEPLVYQLLISDPDEVAPAIDVIESLGASALDVNMGCTAPLIRKRGAGCTLLYETGKSTAILKAIKARTTLPVSVKIRLKPTTGSGRRIIPSPELFEATEEWLADFCTMLQDEGADLLTIHARFVGEPFSRPAKWHLLAGLSQRLTIPYLVNGGIDSPSSAVRALRESRAKGVMIGRYAVVCPWICSEVASTLFGFKPSRTLLKPPDSPEDFKGIFLRFVQRLVDLMPPERRLGRLKEFTHYFAKNFTFGHALAFGVQKAKDLEEAVSSATVFFQGLEGQENWLSRKKTI